MTNTFQDYQEQLLSSYKKDTKMSEQITEQMAEAHEEFRNIPVNPDRLVDEQDRDHVFVQTAADVGEESDETRVD